MTSTMHKNGRLSQTSGNNKDSSAQHPGKLKASPTLRGSATGSTSSSLVGDQRASRSNEKYTRMNPVTTRVNDEQVKATAIEQCVQNELRRYFDMLDGEEPANLYRMVIRQAECALVSMVMEECRGNQTRASEWLGISRGNLRTKLASMDK